MDKNVTIPLLMDLYGKMLSKSKFEDLYAYYSEDFSLSEIAANTNKSRQAVFDSVKHSESALMKFENELGFLKKMDLIKSDFAKIELSTERQRLKAVISKNGKSLYLGDQNIKRSSDFIGNLSIVLFEPSELDLFNDSPRIRRRLLDLENPLLNHLPPMLCHPSGCPAPGSERWGVSEWLSSLENSS